ncbi:MAG TPA: efflux RND transporter periplasmic adaptor subunit [Ramlibacter sp.]|nr:efflux RND transporter periplasmic adaptor subunit [Ramlibacter sp.]
MPHRATPRVFVLPAAAALVMALSACSKPEPAPEPVRSVKVMTIGASAFGTHYEFSAEVRPQVESRLGFRVPGKILRRQAELGQRVKAGQVLAQLDPQDLKLAADAARAQVAAAQTQRDLAAADFKRYAALRDQNFISGAELERRDTALKAAQAQLEQAQAQLSSQGNQAGYAALTASSAGVITAVEADPGQVVAAGAPVVRLALDGPRDAVFALPEDKLDAVKPGADMAVRLWSDNRSVTGKVREVAASADPVTRTYSVKVGLPADANVPLGSTVYVMPQSLGMAGVQVIKLPTSALRKEGQGSAVWVLDPKSMTVKSQPVQVATADGNEVVIGGGLQPGMQVVTAGVHVLQPDQKVTLYQDRYAPAANAATAGAPLATRAPSAQTPAGSAAAAALR